jgi:hypothetical protein
MCRTPCSVHTLGPINSARYLVRLKLKVLLKCIKAATHWRKAWRHEAPFPAWRRALGTATTMTKLPLLLLACARSLPLASCPPAQTHQKMGAAGGWPTCQLWTPTEANHVLMYGGAHIFHSTLCTIYWYIIVHSTINEDESHRMQNVIFLNTNKLL